MLTLIRNYKCIPLIHKLIKKYLAACILPKMKIKVNVCLLKVRNEQPADQLYSRISQNCREKESFKVIHSSHD